MKILARLILSLEKLIKNPVNWFSSQHWLFRMVLVFSLVPLISVISIISYQNIYLGDNQTDSQDIYKITLQEIRDMRKDVERFHESEMEELYYLSETIVNKESADKSVLGVEDDRVAENIRQRLEDLDPNNPDLNLIYIKNDVEEVDVFIDPSDLSKKLATLKAGSFHPALIEEADWWQISLDDGQLGWIKKEFIIKFPTNENR